MPHSSIPLISQKALRTMLTDGRELALLDVRENGTYSYGHLFFAVSAPLSHLEMRLPTLVPRRNTRVVLIDEQGLDDSLATIAAQRMRAWGYDHLEILEGGMQAWKEASLPIFSGVHVPSKAFGEFVEHACDTPSISAETLSDWLKNDKNMIILDSRPYKEYNAFSMPNGICCPGAELPYRVFGTVTDPEKTIVINCAGRTRGIIGAQSLINAGVLNPIVVLENGTAGWYLSGRDLAEKQTRIAPPPTTEALNKASQAAIRVAQRFDVREIDLDTLKKYQQDTTRSLFLLDVRTLDEYEAGHLSDSRSAPGGQVIQATDYYIGVRNARVILIDDNGVRARFTAAWLLQMGWSDVEVLSLAQVAHSVGLEVGPERQTSVAPLPQDIEYISATDLQQDLAADQCVVLDLASSLIYRDRHIPGAKFAIRSEFSQILKNIPATTRIVLTSPDGELAAWATTDASNVINRTVYALSGGTRAWEAAGLPINADRDLLPEPCHDVFYGPYSFKDKHRSMKEYLEWEIDLLGRLDEEESVQFSCSPVISSVL